MPLKSVAPGPATRFSPSSHRVPLTPAALHKRGFITDAERDRLEAYINAAEAYDDAFGIGPGVDAKVDEWRRIMEKLEQAKRLFDEAQQRENSSRSGVVQAAMEQADIVDALISGPVRVLLENDPARLGALKAMVTELRSAATGGAPPDMIGDISRRLSAECLRLRGEVREGV